MHALYVRAGATLACDETIKVAGEGQNRGQRTDDGGDDLDPFGDVLGVFIRGTTGVLGWCCRNSLGSCQGGCGSLGRCGSLSGGDYGARISTFLLGECRCGESGSGNGSCCTERNQGGTREKLHVLGSFVT